MTVSCQGRNVWGDQPPIRPRPSNLASAGARPMVSAVAADLAQWPAFPAARTAYPPASTGAKHRNGNRGLDAVGEDGQRGAAKDDHVGAIFGGACVACRGSGAGVQHGPSLCTCTSLRAHATAPIARDQAAYGALKARAALRALPADQVRIWREQTYER
jgi:hypothetical protein